jgi:hypothetical protein
MFSAVDHPNHRAPRPGASFPHESVLLASRATVQLHALAYNLANFLRTLTLPDEVKHRSRTTLCDRLVKIGAKIVHHSRSIAFQMAEVMVPRRLFQQVLGAIAALRPEAPDRC